MSFDPHKSDEITKFDVVYVVTLGEEAEALGLLLPDIMHSRQDWGSS